MNSSLQPAEYTLARRVLLDGLDALGPHRDAVVLVGAQAVYFHTGDADLAVTPTTTDARHSATVRPRWPTTVGGVCWDGDPADDVAQIGGRMYIAEGQLVLSPTDITKFLECRHLTQLDLLVARGEWAKPTGAGEALDVLLRRGRQHEDAQLAAMRAEGSKVAEITTDGDLAAAEAATLAAMRAGVDVVYQASFFDGRWRGHADFLLKQPGRASELGDWSYDIADTKLARRLKVPALLQMASYAEHLRRLQGVDPEWLVVITGDGAHQPFRLEDCAAYFRRVQADLLATVADSPLPTYPQPVTHCAICHWKDTCAQRRRDDDHLSLVPLMRRDHARGLVGGAVTTVAELAAADPDALPHSIGAPSRHRLVHQASLQIRERETGDSTYALLPHEPGRGLARLPEPSAGDLFFDMEGDPFIGEHGLEYLFGVADTAGRFTAYWAHTPAQEKAAFEACVDHITAVWAEHPGMHVYHYAPYEPTKLKALMSRYATREDEIDRLLRGQRLVDLYAVVRQGLRISKESYSIKALEAFYSPAARAGADVADAGASIVAYERYLQTGDAAALEAIERYNEVDCQSTRLLRDWLEQRRAELVGSGSGGVAVDRPDHGDGLPSGAVEEASAETRELQEELLAGLPADACARSATEQATWLVAQLLDWHRREDKPEWWDYFRRFELSDDELVDDTGAVGLLGPATAVRTEKQSTVWRQEFPPQDTKMHGGQALDPRTGSAAGTLVGIDPVSGWLELKRATSSDKPHPSALVPPGPLDNREQRAALARLGTWIRDHGIDGEHSIDGEHGIDRSGDFRAARDLLLRLPPRRLTGTGGVLVAVGERAADAVVRLATDLDGGVLPVQGPPGSGKTWAGARMVVELVRRGQRVGICAFSHKAIGNLLDEVCRVAEESGVPLRAMQKAGESDRCSSARVDCVGDNATIRAALDTGAVDVVAGTGWLFARADMQARFDTLVIDEAGQMSLANVLAVAGTSRNLVLLGDPQQLAQPAKGVHPEGAGVSALDHVLGHAPTIAADRGVFLDRTWRMHPAVCGFVSSVMYEGRLQSYDSCARQSVASGRFLGAGLRWVPVEHHGNASASSEEAEVVRGLVADVVGSAWTDAGGVSRRLTLADVLVIAPYNAQVARLRGRLPGGARIGTVDKFQGQEAPVVIYSMATSSAADAPRDLEFLYSLNRLNVAVSRARGLAMIVASPRLLDAPVRTPHQLRLVNALCRYVEVAESIRD